MRERKLLYLFSMRHVFVGLCKLNGNTGKHLLYYFGYLGANLPTFE